MTVERLRYLGAVHPGHRAVALLCLLALSVGALGCGDDATPNPASGDANVELRDGGTEAFKRELERLRGKPVVVNQWASWCGPCRAEFPYFQPLAERYRGRVAFLGVNSQDSRDEAREFLSEYPTPFPHFDDPDAKIARTFRGGRAWPTTAYYDADGELNSTHQGQYRTQEDLDRDVRRYAIDG